ncbi:hypothetical protein [Saccharopolyspora sp. 5N708]|uniref:hypothetical protein n=1 Tax=Saccharopolyspora sp. 5N708 TaxID=3457424 RepID=UPI003FD3FBF8
MMVVLAAFTAVLRQPVVALGVVFVLANTALAVFLRTAARGSGYPGWVGAVVQPVRLMRGRWP